MKYTIYCMLTLFFLYACGSSEKKADKLYEEVMDIHDDAMAKIGDVMRLQNSLDENIHELQAADSSANKKPRIEYLQQLKESLKASDESMMEWMRQFDNEMHDMTAEQKIEYLQVQQQKVQDVNEKIDTSIKNAEEALK